MNADDFYKPSDSPSQGQRQKMWRAVEAATRQQAALVFAIRDRRSFLYGMAAAILMAFSCIGIYSVLTTALQSREPAELRFDAAYRSAIQEFESVLPTATRDDAGDSVNLIKRQQLALIDAAVRELREDIARTDLSPLKRSRLRQLYSMKLRVLQEIIAQGDIEL